MHRIRIIAMNNVYNLTSLSDNSQLASAIQVLLVEPDAQKTQRIKQYLGTCNAFVVNVDRARSLRNVLSLIKASSYDILLLSLNHNQKQNLNAIQRARRANPDLPIIILSDTNDEVLSLQGLKHGIQDWVALDEIQPEALIRVVRHAIERQKIIRDLENQRQRAHQIATHDPLTGLPNRILLNDRLNQAINRIDRYGSLLALVYLDLDRFKIVNDSLGHSMGDALLKEVATRLSACIRKSDSLARISGDEFIFILDNLKSKRIACTISAKILKSLSTAFYIKGHELFISGTVGVAYYPKDASTAEGLVNAADSAMYSAKENGRNGYRVYSEELISAAVAKFDLENRLRSAIQRQEFELHYQPQVDVETNRVIAVEALVRWKNTENQIVDASEFIPLAEETGLILPLGSWVLRRACHQMNEWRKSGYLNTKIAVNLSALQLTQNELFEEIIDILKETELPPEFLDLEVTETSLMENPHDCADLLGRLKNKGISITIDDFGTGYSSLSQLRSLPINTLKIDQSFIRNMENDGTDVIITRTIISMAKNLKLNVIAEGVETQDQLNLLAENSCRNMQGYFFGKPCPAKQCAQWLTVN